MSQRKSSKDDGKKHELLEVPAIPVLERRLDVFDKGPPTRPCIAPVPKSALLSRLQNFMPEMQAANEKLQQELQVRPASDFDVENVPEGQEHGYIEMDLACGIIDLKDSDAVKAAESSLEGHLPSPLVQNQCEEGSSDLDDDECQESDDPGDEDTDGEHNVQPQGRSQRERNLQTKGSSQQKLCATREGQKDASKANGFLTSGKKTKKRPQITEL